MQCWWQPTHSLTPSPGGFIRCRLLFSPSPICVVWLCSKVPSLSIPPTARRVQLAVGGPRSRVASSFRSAAGATTTAHRVMAAHCVAALTRLVCRVLRCSISPSRDEMKIVFFFASHSAGWAGTSTLRARRIRLVCGGQRSRAVFSPYGADTVVATVLHGVRLQPGGSVHFTPPSQPTCRVFFFVPDRLSV